MRDQSQARMSCNVLIEEHDADGLLVRTEEVRNLVVLTGRNLIRDLLGGLFSAPTHIAAGTDASPVSDSDTALGAQVYADVITRRVQGSSQIKFQLFIPTTAANGNSLTEAGIQTIIGATTTLFARVTFPAFAKTLSNTLTLSWTINIASS